MIRSRGIGALIVALVLACSAARAHEIAVLYTRTDPVPIAVHYQHMVKVQFWDVVLDVSTTIPATALEVRTDPHFPDTILLANLAEKTRGMVYVTTASGAVVHMDVRHWGPPAQKVIVKDARTEVERARQQADERTGLTREERAVRQLWRAQWGFPTDQLVQVETVHVVLESNDVRRVVLTRRYETVGFYGFTQRVRNLTTAPLPLHPSTVTVNCPLFSVALDGHEPPVGPGGDPHTILPGGAVLVHLTCQGARHAPVR
jgi:hypothetical protein